MRTSFSSRCFAAVGVVGLIAAAGLVVAGPLTPPAGAVSSSYKTLSDVEPRTAIGTSTTPGDADHMFLVMQPGSYYLKGNITVPAGKSAIGVYAAGDVTIDLNGFSITGGLDGVTGTSLITDGTITVRNGTLRGGTGHGVSLTGFARALVENVNVLSYAGTGIMTSPGATVRGCVAENCGSFGIAPGWGSLVEECRALGNDDDGIYVSTGSRVVDCVSQGNGGEGVATSGDGNLVTGTSSMYNTMSGFRLSEKSVVRNCVATLNDIVGFKADDHCTLSDCVASENRQQGFHAADKVSMMGCEARGNGTGGVYAGFWLSGVGGRIEDCIAIDNDYGIVVHGSDNVVVKNSCRGNASGNFTVGVGNEGAPVVTNPGANGYATMTSWSNVAY